LICDSLALEPALAGEFDAATRAHRDGEQDLFRSRLDQIIDMKHPLVTLGRAVDWGFLERRFGEVYDDDPGRPPLPTRLMAGLAILKHTYDLSDEVLCERWVENPYYQLLRRGILPASAGVRSLVDDALAQPHGRGAADGVDPGELTVDRNEFRYISSVKVPFSSAGGDALPFARSDSTAHNGLVAGSSPAGPTNEINTL
jgi:transposase-like protein DUF772